jgi:hypothetical protein
LQLSLKASGDSGAGRRVARPEADSSEDSEDDVDEQAAADVDHERQQLHREEQLEENLRFDQELRNLRQEQAYAADNLLQQVGAFELPLWMVVPSRACSRLRRWLQHRLHLSSRSMRSILFGCNWALSRTSYTTWRGCHCCPNHSHSNIRVFLQECVTHVRSELTIMKDVNAGLLSSIERSKAAADSKSSELAVLNAQLMSEVNQLHTDVASKEERISKLKVQHLMPTFICFLNILLISCSVQSAPHCLPQVTVAGLENSASAAHDAAAQRENQLQLRADELLVRCARAMPARWFSYSHDAAVAAHKCAAQGLGRQ